MTLNVNALTDSPANAVTLNRICVPRIPVSTESVLTDSLIESVFVARAGLALTVTKTLMNVLDLRVRTVESVVTW